jgi:phosphatidate cytidylyltransferase
MNHLSALGASPGAFSVKTGPAEVAAKLGLPDFVVTQPEPLLYGGALLLVLLAIGSLAALILPVLQKDKWSDLRPRMISWWVIVILFVGALLAGWQAFVLLMAFVSFLALKEFLTIAPTRKEDRLVIFLAYASILVNYWAIWIDNYDFYLVITPVYVFLITAFAMAWIGRTDGFLPTMGIVHWGVIICVYNVGYVAYLMRTPMDEVPQAGPIGLVFFLIFITQINDVAQYVWGKMLGKRKISPNVSPNKTWEGAIGGWITAGAVFVLLAPYFTPLEFWHAVFLGATLPIAGFAGDLTMSAVKRDLGVKDMSHLIPGHGGALDRLDSLTFTAPWFFHWLAYFALERF